MLHRGRAIGAAEHARQLEDPVLPLDGPHPAGHDRPVIGTLDDEMRAPDLAMRVWAKTGTMAYVRSLAGWLFAHDGRPLLFALFANDAAARARYDATPIPDRGRLNAEAASWLARAKGLHEALLAHWAAAGGRPAAQVSCTAPACRAASVR